MTRIVHGGGWLAGALAAVLAAAPAWGLTGLERAAPAARPDYLLAGTPVDAMPAGMREAYIRGIQEELAGHGYRPGRADGVIGGRTRAAIRRYQRDAGLPVDGLATKELLDHLKFVLPKVYARATAAAEPNGLVFEVQAELHRRGYYGGPLDGLMGPRTREAVRDWQRDAGLPVTGSVDSALIDAFRAMPTSPPAR